MRILLATPIYPPDIGGPASYARELSERLTPAHSLTVVAYTDEGVPYGHALLKKVAASRWLPVRLLIFFATLVQESRRHDIIYAQNAVAAGLPAVCAGYITRTPVVIKFVGDEAWERARRGGHTEKLLEDFMREPEGPLSVRLVMWLQGMVLRRATSVTTPSQHLKACIETTYRVLPDRVNVNKNASEHSIHVTEERTRGCIATVARLTNWKGIDGIIRALSDVRKHVPDAHLVIAGDGPERKALETLAEKHDLIQAVTFLGHVSREHVHDLLSSAHIFVLNSTYEGMPHVVLEAYAHRCVVVATDIPGTNECVAHNHTGLLVEPKNDATLASALVSIFNDPTRSEHLRKNGHAFLTQKFSWERHIATLLGMFDGVVK
jgi:glycosyltransferase involved in cell wall biosynthesis